MSAFPLRPVIGITTSLNEGEQRLDHAYVRAVEAAGGLPVLVPMALDAEGAADALFEHLSGLVVTGGPAVVEGLVRDAASPTLPADLDATHPLRLAADRSLLKRFVDSDKPVLGICYGMQLLNASFGGTIYADVELQQPGAGVHSQKRGGTTHSVTHAPDSHMARLLGESVTVNTRHVQAIASVGRGLNVSGLAPDGVIEAFEGDDGRLLGVQYHPERLGPTGAPLFEHLVARAKRHD